jgi:hypothetical protein
LLRRNPYCSGPFVSKQVFEEEAMNITFTVAVAAAVLTTVSLITPTMAQVDVQVGPRYDRYDRDSYGDRGRRYDRDTTVGIGPGGVTIGPRRHCRMVTTTVERDDGRRVTRRERRCD